MDLTKIELEVLLCAKDKVIRRHAEGILKRLQDNIQKIEIESVKIIL